MMTPSNMTRKFQNAKTTTTTTTKQGLLNVDQIFVFLHCAKEGISSRCCENRSTFYWLVVGGKEERFSFKKVNS